MKNNIKPCKECKYQPANEDELIEYIRGEYYVPKALLAECPNCDCDNCTELFDLFPFREERAKQMAIDAWNKMNDDGKDK